jgi:hypothetical protein
MVEEKDLDKVPTAEAVARTLRKAWARSEILDAAGADCETQRVGDGETRVDPVSQTLKSDNGFRITGIVKCFMADGNKFAAGKPVDTKSFVCWDNFKIPPVIRSEPADDFAPVVAG